MEKKKKLIILGVILLLIIVSGATFAILTWNSTMIKLGINTNCFTIDYTRGGDITGSLKLINEEDLISNGKFTIKEGVGVSGVNIGINSNCSIEGFGSIYLNVTNISDVFTTGDSKGALKYVVLKNTSTITNPTNINTTSLLNQSFDIESKGSITNSDTITLLIKQLSNTELYKYIIVIYIDNNLAGNDITSATFSGNISSEASQLYETPEYCFPITDINETEKTATLIGYSCGDDNAFGYTPITDIVVIPSYVSAREYTLKENLTDKAKENCTFLLSYVFDDQITNEQAKTLCNGGTVNEMTLESLYNQYKNEIAKDDSKQFLFVSSGMLDTNINNNVKYKVTKIKGNMDGFADFIKAKMAVIPESITTIGEYTFDGSGLISIIIPNSITTIGDFAFEYNQLTSITLPDSVTTIGSQAFANNQLTNVTLGNSVITIGEDVFYNNQLTNIAIPDSVTTIGSSAFQSNQLTNIVIPDSVTTIGSQAFANNQLTSITIPDSVTTIGSSAFAYNNLNYVYIGSDSKLTDISYNAFSSSNRTSTYKGITYVDNSNLKKIYYNGSNSLPWIFAINGSDSDTKFVTGTVPSYTNETTIYNEVLITTGK